MIKINEYKKFLEKVNAGCEITILYFGGSITAGAGTYPTTGIGIDGKEYNEIYDFKTQSWRELSFKWLKDKFQKYLGQFKQVNACIGGTGSLFGALRFNVDVVKFNPDLIFIDFAVNDNGVAILTENDPYNNKSIFRTLYSIVNRLKKLNPDIAIFMPLSTYRLDGKESYNEWLSIMQKSADITKTFCDIFNIPYVSIYDAYYTNKILKDVEKVRLYKGNDEAGNIVHPAAYGHKIYSEAVCKILDNIFNSFNFEFYNYKIVFSTDKESFKPYPVSPTFIFADKFDIEYNNEQIIEIDEGDMHSIIKDRKVLLEDGDNHV